LRYENIFASGVIHSNHEKLTHKISLRKNLPRMKTIVTVAKPLINNDNILQGSFLTISNALKQFPVLNVSHLKLMHSRFLFHKVKMLRKYIDQIIER
jgi:hypothetical protein